MTTEIMSPELRRALDNPKARYRIVDAVLARTAREAGPTPSERREPNVETTANPAITEAIDARAAQVADRLRAWMDERPVWLLSELASRANAEHIDILAWLTHPIVRAVGVKGKAGQLWDGASGVVYAIVGEGQA